MATTAAPASTTNGTAPAEAEAPQDPKRFGEPGTGTLDERIARIGGLVSVHADAQMSAGRGSDKRTYKYASIDAMSAALGPLLAAEGVTISPQKVKVLTQEVITRQKEGDRGSYDQHRHLSLIRITWRIAGAGDSFTVESLGKSADAEGSEKDVNQAHTFARINLFKSLFHFTTGDDPEAKGQGSNGSGGGGGAEHSGELPNMAGVSVNGDVRLGPEGQIGLAYAIEPRTAQQEVNRFVTRALGGKWDGQAKLYAIPRGNEREALTLARHIGLTVSVEIEGMYPPPAEPAPAEQAALPGTESGRAADPDAG